VAPKQQKPESSFQISYITITYRAVVWSIVGVLALAAVSLYLIFPEQVKDQLAALGERIVPGVGGEQNAAAAAGQQQARFTNIDGTVRVKRAGSSVWLNADYGLPLKKGDVVQTGSEGMARVVFTDGTSYTVKPDSLIVVEENSKDAAQQTQVAVQVTTGTVDLATATFGRGSKSQVIVAGARATLAPESAAQVRNDPRGDEHEILVKKGSGEVQRGDEVVSLGSYEKVSFKMDSPEMSKVKEISPPTLIDPGNMIPIFISPNENKPVNFTWTPVDNARGYRVRVSRNPYFSSIVVDKKVKGTQLQLMGVGEGAYYWSVTSLGDKGKESVESERNRFTVIPKGAEDVALMLELEPFVQHGHVIEVRGRTEANARVMVNGDEVALIGGDGKFHYFTPPLPTGENVITVTAQNARGAVNTQQKKVVIQ
jgi:hypothetical protein